MVSSTRMGMLSRCGEQFRRRYVEHDIVPPGVALIVGSAVDRSVTKTCARRWWAKDCSSSAR